MRGAADMPRECFDDNTAVEFFEGSLTSQVARGVEVHAARCEGCRLLLAEMARNASYAGIVPTLPAAGDAHISLHRGQEVGRFLVLNRIGTGGMGVVFAAYDPKLDRKVALKLLRGAEDSRLPASEAQARLQREAQAMAQLSHPNVIAVYDVGTYKSEVYIAMELVEGSTLTEWLRRWDRSYRDVLAKFTQAGQALAAAHAAGLLHRDFKPDNVLVGSDERVRVMDFGLARSLLYDGAAEAGAAAARVDAAAVRGLHDGSLTRTGTLLGTPRYMPPEQFLGRDADARSDQFSYCVALYEALYGQHPFERETALDLLDEGAGAVRSDPSPRPAPPRTSVPAWLHRVVVRGLSADPAQRYPSMDALLAEAVPPKPAPPRRIWMPVAAALTAAVVLLAIHLVQSRERAAAAVSQRGETAQQLVGALGELEQLRLELVRLQTERDQLLVRLGDSSRREVRIAELEQRLTEKQARVAELEQVVARTARPPPLARAPRPPPGLAEAQVTGAVARHADDIDVCFREWRERQPAGGGILAYQLAIGPSGRASVERTEGLGDRIVRACVGGVLRSASYPITEAITVVHYAFSVSESGVTATAQVVASLPPPPADRPLMQPSLTPDHSPM